MHPNKFIKQTPNFFLILLSVSFFIYFLWLIKLLGDFPWRYVFTDWIINYEGGYVRRGLLGEFSVNLSKIFHLNIKYIFFIVHLFIFFIFHYFFYKFFSNFNRNYFFYLLCFSPLVFLYPISTFEAFARKEIFYITFFLINCYILAKIENRKLAFWTTNTLVLLSYFIHESSLLFIYFYYFSFLIFLKRKEYPLKINEIIFVFIILIFLIFLTFIPVTDEKMLKMVTFISENFYEVSRFTGAISSLQGNLRDATSFWTSNPANFFDIFQHILIIHFVFIFIYFLFKFNFFKLGKFYLIFTLITFFSPIILFILGWDWGRFVYILYNFALIFTFYCLYNDKDIFLKIDKLIDVLNINNKLKILFTLCYLSLWCPKLLYYENVEYFALIKLIIQLINYSIKYGYLVL